MSCKKVERETLLFKNTEFLDDFPVKGIRLVQVPHMSRIHLNAEEITNVREFVGTEGEAYN